MPQPTSPLISRRSSKKILRFSIMVAGQSGLGKTTFLRTLFKDQVSPPIEEESDSFEILLRTEAITPYCFEMEADDGVRILVEAIDTPGFNDDFQHDLRAKQLLEYIESTFDEVFEEEQRVHRNPKFEEHRIHALLYFIEPTGLGLKDSDYQLMKILSNRINVIPIIAKADSLTKEELVAFKEKIAQEVAGKNIPTFDFSKFSSADQLNMSGCPLTVIGATFPIKNETMIGRNYPWGFVDVYDSEACDFNLLKAYLLQIFRDDLKESTEDHLYEQYRTEKLLKLNGKA